jgi:DNA-directed RNA polymerase specialized sigma24 family protein
LQAGQKKTGRSREEIAEAIRDLSPAGWARLKKVARRYAAGRPMTVDDLLQEGYARALDGRVCPHDVDVVRFLAEAMIRDEDDRAVQQAIVALFADDETAQIIVEGMMDGLEGEELRELCGLNQRAYASERRMIRRRIDKAYPKGWKL